MANQVCTWDFTLKFEDEITPVARLNDFLKTHCKKWAYQLEESEGGYVHYQGRFSLKLKDRLGGVRNKWVMAGWPAVHLSITSNANRDNDFYVMKPEGRKSGPWTDQDQASCWDIECFPDRLPWHKDIIATADVRERRIINVIADTEGNMGKSYLVKWAQVNKVAQYVPPLMDATKLVGYILTMPKRSLYLVDLPRALDQKKLGELYNAIEQLKNGMVFDWRYGGKCECFPCPQVWVFCNEKPSLKYLSQDRWCFWKVVEGELIVDA